ncbi:MAG TPA: CBS domain-containing protein [Myxococcota bacterium]|jgi:CBS domain-containing protein|nr:CBS domain-containing protein [Myxococcota bacterium]
MASMEDYALDEMEQSERARLRGAFLRKPLSEVEPTRPRAVRRDATAAEAIRAMMDAHAGCVCIVEDGRLLGIFTERDVLNKVAGRGLDPAKVRVADVMTANPEALHPEDEIVYCLAKMTVGGFRHVPLVDGDGRPVGIIAMRDIVRYLVSLFPEAVLNTAPEPALAEHKTPDGA